MLNLFSKFRQWRNKQILDQSTVTELEWQAAIEQLALLDSLTQVQRKHLIELATLFLHQKTISGAQDFVITDEVRQSIALQACLPILHLGLDWYSGWSTVIVYPGNFRRKSFSVDEYGVSHSGSVTLSGEAWLKGPVVLAWTDVEDAGARDGRNVVIHEFVHKLDMLNGRANGFPPLHNDMDPKQWTDLMSAAYHDFEVNPKEGLDRYGATNPAEFFAVLSEVYFETPATLSAAYPEIHDLMTQFFLSRTDA